MISKRDRRNLLCLVGVVIVCIGCSTVRELVDGSRVTGTLEVELGSKSGLDDAMCPSDLD